MNIEGFKEEVKNINNNSYGFGNDVLYTMASKFQFPLDDTKLSGAIWLIGRSYAASPQRRSYGTFKTNEGNKVSVWPVLTSNDGREDFFLQIAKNLRKNNSKIIIDGISKDIAFEYCRNEMFKKNEVNRKSKDFIALKKGILSVLSFNLDLCLALEQFDKVPSQNYVFNGKSVVCSNHISFCSKFLHFCFPNVIYIIDNFSFVGSGFLFRKKPKEYGFDGCGGDWFDKTVHDFFNNDTKKLLDAILLDDEISKQLDDYSDRQKNRKGICEHASDTLNGKKIVNEKTNAEDYIKHCVRSYMLGLFIEDNHIEPAKQVSSGTLKPMSRLTDTVFLNIKKSLTDKEKMYLKELKNTYHIKI